MLLVKARLTVWWSPVRPVLSGPWWQRRSPGAPAEWSWATEGSPVDSSPRAPKDCRLDGTLYCSPPSAPGQKQTVNDVWLRLSNVVVFFSSRVGEILIQGHYIRSHYWWHTHIWLISRGVTIDLDRYIDPYHQRDKPGLLTFALPTAALAALLWNSTVLFSQETQRLKQKVSKKKYKWRTQVIKL